MLAIVHLLAGAVIGLAFNDIAAIVAISFFVHYLMDLFPHIDPETFASKKLPYTWTQLSLLLTDALLAVIVGIVLFTTHTRWDYVLVGSIASLVPDFLIPLERYRIFYPLRRFHYMFHWNPRNAARWSGYIAGIVTPTVFAAVTGVILWWSF